jgi:hypothetical protein
MFMLQMTNIILLIHNDVFYFIFKLKYIYLNIFVLYLNEKKILINIFIKQCI